MNAERFFAFAFAGLVFLTVVGDRPGGRIQHAYAAEPAAASAAVVPAYEKEDYTREADRDFARELQRALSENDRAWLLDHFDYKDGRGFGVLVTVEKNRERDINTRREAERALDKGLDELFPPDVRAAVLNSDLRYLRASEMVWIGSYGPPYAWVSAVARCMDRKCTEERYRINNIQYDKDPDYGGNTGIPVPER